mgnify:FL=1
MRLAYGINAAQGHTEAPSVQYWRGRNGEVDYVFEAGDTPVTIALSYRSSTYQTKLDALAEFRNQYQAPVGLLVSGDTSNRLDPVIEREEGVIELPFWLISCCAENSSSRPTRKSAGLIQLRPRWGEESALPPSLTRSIIVLQSIILRSIIIGISGSCCANGVRTTTGSRNGFLSSLRRKSR